MSIDTIGIVSPGDMGEAVGAVLAGHGRRVLVALDGRSERTRGLAARAGFEDVGSLAALIRGSDVVMSILVPANALSAALEVAQAMQLEQTTPLYVDCNAISAVASHEVAAAIEAAGAPFVDASIIGPPPRKPGVTRFYASGTQAERFAELGEYGLDVRVVGDQIGQASDMKTCYASLTKGLLALSSGILVLAKHRGLEEAFHTELALSQPELLEWISGSYLSMPPKAHRFVGEMEEHGKGYEAAGLTPKMMQGAADMYRFIAATPLGQESPEDRDRSRTLETAVAMLADSLRQ